MTIAFRVTHVQIRAFAKRKPADGLGFDGGEFGLQGVLIHHDSLIVSLPGTTGSAAFNALT